MSTNQATPLDILKHLPELPKPNLDDRTYKDFVDECVLRIPRYCPEWTNYNPADPGITLIELFSWLTDQMLWRFNQVPIRQYIAFLELLGVRLASPKSAKGELSFYLSRTQAVEKRIPAIQAGTEVSTERTDNQEAIIFSTDQELKVGIPHIRNFLIASNISSFPADLSTGNLGELQDGFYRWSPEDRGSRWSGREQLIFQPTPQEQDGFYLIFGAETLENGEFQSLDGHIITLDIEGQLAGPTGINPKRPPRDWEAWDGKAWQPVLLSEEHDETFGFSFDETGQANQRGARRATITLHMPQNWPQTTFQSQTGAPYTGFWVRCVYRRNNTSTEYNTQTVSQFTYRRSPRFTALEIRAVGGVVPVTQCTYVGNELLGESNGKPGQEFSLQSDAILERAVGEYLEVLEPGKTEPQIWTEVTDFADSGPNDHHYILDSARGVVQLGPLVREPAQLKEDVEFRHQIQRASYETSSTLDDNERAQQQYGKVPSKGSRLYMKAYRTGGGTVGNLQPGALRILKSAVPYVARVTNYKATTGGVDGETLDQAVMRVPRLLRTRDRAITIEDYEALALDASSQIHRAKCLPTSGRATGRIELLLTPKQPSLHTNHGRFGLSQKLRKEVEAFLQDRSILGTSVQVKTADYVRVKVIVKLLPDNDYPPSVQEEIIQTTQQHLYRFLNPVTGGWSETGWEFGNTLHESDIVGYLHKQRIMGIRSVGDIQLFLWDAEEQHWILKDNSISLSSIQLIDSWASDNEAFMGHVVELV